MFADWYRRRGKRWLDIVAAAALLCVLGPAMAVLAWVVQRRLGRPSLFRQERPGWHDRPFTILKFRTMTDARNREGGLLPDVERLTPFGKLLRRTSLDELPELVNVLRGEMSLVGPRPLLMRYLPYFTPEERLRFEVRPGITGWAQVKGRNDLPWDERFVLDVWYVQHLSLALDLKILALTIFKVLRRENVQDVPSLTVPDLDELRRDQCGPASRTA